MTNEEKMLESKFLANLDKIIEKHEAYEFYFL